MSGETALRFAAGAALLLLAGCGSSTGPTAGTLKINLTTPHADDGGMLLTITGGPIDSVEAPGNQVFIYRANANSLRVIIAGEVRAGTVARIHVPDVRQVTRYSAALGQVAARTHFAQRDPTLYSVSLVP